MGNKKLKQTDLNQLKPVVNGVDLLKEDFKLKRYVFCVCHVARDYHVGAHDAFDTLFRATGKESDRPALLVADKDTLEFRDDAIFFPKNLEADVKKDIDKKIEFKIKELESIYANIREVDSSYIIGKRLYDQPGDFRVRYLESFNKLKEANILPITVGNAVFNHQGMYLLMESCFFEHSRLLDYLRNPDILQIEEVKFPRVTNGNLSFQYQELMLAESVLSNNWLGLRILIHLHEKGPARISSVLDYFNQKLKELSQEDLYETLFKLMNSNVIDISPEGVNILNEGNNLLRKIEEKTDIKLSIA